VARSELTCSIRARGAMHAQRSLMAMTGSRRLGLRSVCLHTWRPCRIFAFGPVSGRVCRARRRPGGRLFYVFPCPMVAFGDGTLCEYSAGRRFSSMKVKTSITLSRDILDAIDARAGRGRSRSEFIEAALRVFLDQARRGERDAKDLDILNRRAKRLNREATDVLGYQVIP
jgi:Arc/MetJ-type ribon-helix-helix transcriptional regulator